MLQLHVSLHPDITVLQETSVEQVSEISYLFEELTKCCAAVRVWDIVGEDKTLKGEYKVISGRMWVNYCP